MTGYLGWIVAAFLAGFLLGRHLQFAPFSLRRQMMQVCSFRGLSYRDVLRIAGRKPVTVINKPDGTSIRIWCDAGYYIMLNFDRNNICQGVFDEKESM